MRKIDARLMEVQAKPRSFAGETPVELTPERHLEIHQNLTQGTHHCHSVKD